MFVPLVWHPGRLMRDRGVDEDLPLRRRCRPARRSGDNGIMTAWRTDEAVLSRLIIRVAASSALTPASASGALSSVS